MVKPTQFPTALLVWKFNKFKKEQIVKFCIFEI